MTLVDAKAVFEEEKARHESMRVLERVNEELERSANRKIAAALVTEEQERRMTMEKNFAMQENLERVSNMKLAEKLVSDEKIRRETLGVPTHEKFFEHVPAIANDAARSVQKKQILLEEEEERKNRVFEEKKLEFIVNLERQFNRNKADRRMEEERVRRITEDHKIDVLHELERKNSKKQVLQALEDERKRLILTESIYKDGQQGQFKNDLNEKVMSAYNQRETVRAENAARLERIMENLFQACANEAVRVANRKTVDRAADNERQERMWKESFANIASQTAEKGRYKQVLEAIESTKKELASKELEAIKARESCAELAEILCEISRRGNQKEADREMDEEQAFRTLKITKDNVLSDLERAVAWKRTKALVDDEVSFISHKRLHSHVLEELNNRTTCQSLARLIEESRAYWKEEAENRAKAVNQPGEFLSDIERKGNQCKAVKRMEAERSRRVLAEQYTAILQDLERAVAWRDTAQLLEDEIARVQHQRKLASSLSAVESNSRAKCIKEQIENRRRELLAAPPPEFTLPSEVLEGVERRGNQKAALREMDLEKERRTLADTVGSVVREQLVREVNGRSVEKAVQEEQAQRVAKFKAERVLDQLEHTVRQKEVAKATEEERLSRVASMREMIAARRADNIFQAILDQVEFQSRKTNVEQACEQEREERIMRERLDVVFQDLLRHLHRMTAISMAEEERTIRVAAGRKLNALAELERRKNQLEADELMNAEQAFRAAHETEDLKARSNVAALYDIFEAVERLYNKKQALSAMEEERQRRILVESFSTVMEQLERKAASKSADKQVQEEQGLRVAMNKFADVLVHLERFHNWARVNSAMDEEQKERSDSVKELLSTSNHDLSECHRQLLSKASWKATSKLVEDERDYYAVVERASAVHEQLIRTLNAKEADKLVELERARFVHQMRFEQVLDELVRHVRQKALDSEVEEERLRRTADAATRAMKFASLARRFLSDINASNNVSTLGFTVVDPSDDWDKLSPRFN